MFSRLYTLVLVVVVAWSSCVVFGSLGVSVVALLFVCALVLSGRWRVSLLIGLFCVAILFALLLPTLEKGREDARRMTCVNQFKHIALAVHKYAQVNRFLPPAYVADENGKPMHSWRVLILPYMESNALYKQYDFNEPWDGPDNRKLLKKRPRFYACPSDRKNYIAEAVCTNYVAVVGSNAAWNGHKPRSFSDFSGGTSNTIMLVETADAGIGWTEPKDLDMDALTVVDDSASQVKPTSRHMHSNGFFYHDTPSVVNVAMMDGSIRSLPADLLTRENCKKLFQIGGFKDKVELECKKPELQINWLNVIAFAVWLVAVILLFYQAVHSRKTRLPEGGPIEKGEKETVEPSSQA